MKIVATIEARMSSSRLPGKVMMAAAGRPMLAHLVGRLRQVPSIDAIVLATTTNDADQILADFAADQDIGLFRGSEEDVMSRVIGAAESADAGIVVEITGDCPVIDQNIVEQTIRMFLNNPCDYINNVDVPGYPGGMDTQVYALETLKRSAVLTSHPLDREHVTRHIRRSPEMFRQLHLVAPPDLHWPDLDLTLDEPADYVLLKNIIEYFGEDRPYFDCRDIIRLLRDVHPEWREINRDVGRKGMDA